jgi:hypothetical protein
MVTCCVCAARYHPVGKDLRFSSMGLSLWRNGSTSVDRTAPAKNFAENSRYSVYFAPMPRQPEIENGFRIGRPVLEPALFYNRGFNRGDILDALTAFGLFAVTAMLVFYALEKRSPWFILAFALACALGSVYGFLQGAWPFGAVEAVWSVVAFRRWWLARYPK